MCDGLGFHLCLGAETGNGLVGAALDGLGALTGGCSCEGACGKHDYVCAIDIEGLLVGDKK